MARTLKRTDGERQIAPDSLLGQRFLFPYSAGVPVADATETWPLMPSAKKPGVFSQLGGVEYVGLRRREEIPALEWPTPLYGVKKSGIPMIGDGKTTVTLLSQTSKMSCPSFSIAAGPPKEGGTCVSAALPPSKRGTQEGQTFTCSVCYSLENRYSFQSTTIPQAARMAWVEQYLEEDPTGELWALQMLMAITDYARSSTLGGKRVYTAADLKRDKAIRIQIRQKTGKKSKYTGPSTGPLVRITQELGVWENGRLLVPIGRHPVNYHELHFFPAFETTLPAWTGMKSSRQYLASLGPSDGNIAGFFRIHDSGDFSLGRKPALWASYIRAWALIAQALPHVVFWGPTRVWVLPNLAEVLREAAAIAPNLILRPSALNTDELAPDIDGLAMGTTVFMPEVRGKDVHYKDLVNLRTGGTTMRCPVYTKVEEGVEAPNNCQDAHCRACWIQPDIAVGYGLH